MKCWGVQTLLVRVLILGNEVSENGNRYGNSMELLRYSQCLWKHKTNTAKAIADKVDFGAVVLPVTDDDKKMLESLTSTGSIVEPNLVYHIYKNRRSRYTAVKLWCSSDMSNCRVTPIFLTDNYYKVIPIENFNIIVEEDEDEINFQ